ncbi:putative chymopapain protein, partial [Tanacetum coccineum]
DVSVRVTISGYHDVPRNNENSFLKALANLPISVAIDASGRDFQFYSGQRSRLPYSKELLGTKMGRDRLHQDERNTSKSEGICGLYKMASYPTKQNKGFYVGESSRQNMGNMLNKYQQMVSELSNDQGNEGSWIKRKLNNIRLKRLHDINNKIEILESQQENRNKEELKAKRLKKVRCYKCKQKGHFVNNCPVWKKKGKAKIVEEEDKESVAENHKPTIGKLKPRKPYT